MVTFLSETVTLGDVIRRFRLQAGMSQEALAEVSGVERSYISMIENDHRNPSYDIVKALAASLGLLPSTVYRAAEMEMPRPEEDDDASVIRIDDPKLAAAIRRIARWGFDRVARLERVGREMYQGQYEQDEGLFEEQPQTENGPG